MWLVDRTGAGSGVGRVWVRGPPERVEGHLLPRTHASRTSVAHAHACSHAVASRAHTHTTASRYRLPNGVGDERERKVGT